MDIMQAFKDGFRDGWIASKKEYDKPPNNTVATDKGPCPYCRENFITYPDHDFCGSCGMALNR